MNADNADNAMIHARVFLALSKAAKRSSNRYAIAHYCGALNDAQEIVNKGASWAHTLNRTFCGRLLTQVGKAAGCVSCPQCRIEPALLEEGHCPKGCDAR